MKLTHIITSTTSVFETGVSEELNNGKIDDQEFQVLQTLHLEVINELSNADHKMELETRAQMQKGLLEEINEIKNTSRIRDAL